MNPHGQEEAHGEAEQMRHRAAAELAGARRSSLETGEGVIGDSSHQRRIRVRRQPSRGGE
jgi:hypothetical protein